MSHKRTRLVEAARELFYCQGFNETTLVDIAERAQVPLGNVYYYFKTKEEIGRAVITEHTDDLQALFTEWEREPDPKRRLYRYLEMLHDHRESLARHGCPVGTLCQELNKERTPLAERADGLLRLQLDWFREQFRDLGRDDAEDLALELIARLQGLSVLATALHDPTVVERLVVRVKAWLEAL